MTPMLEPLAAFRERMLVLSGLDNKPGLALPGEPAGGHGRIGGSFLTGVHVKPTEGADFEAGISIDQIAARELGQKTELASLELSLDTTEFAGACDAGFSCAYTTTLCWRGPTAPVPMEHDPRAVFERLFGDSGSTDRTERLSRLTANRSILDSVTGKLARLQRDLGARDREKLSQYVDAIRDVERRIQRAEEQSARELPVVEQPAGAPDSFEAYARADVRSAGAGATVRSDARHHLHAGLGAERADLSRSRRGRSAPCDLASSEPGGQPREDRQDRRLPLENRVVLPRTAPDRRRTATGRCWITRTSSTPAA